MSQAPSIGRIVHYTTGDGDRVPAIITCAEPPSNEVDLFVMTPEDSYNACGVDQGDGPLQWNWPTTTPKKPKPTVSELVDIIRENIQESEWVIAEAIVDRYEKGGE